MITMNNCNLFCYQNMAYIIKLRVKEFQQSKFLSLLLIAAEGSGQLKVPVLPESCEMPRNTNDYKLE